MVTKVEAYRASTGGVFETENLAVLAETRAERLAAARWFCTYIPYSDTSTTAAHAIMALMGNDLIPYLEANHGYKRGE